MKTQEKIGAFVIRQLEGESPKLLLFTHVDFPDAPIQIPGGGIESDELPEEALWRELREESGLSGLPIIRKIGVSEVQWKDRILRRHCYLLDGAGLPNAWEQTVVSSGEDNGLRFSFSWHAMSPSLRLSGDLGEFLTPEAIPELYKLPEASRKTGFILKVCPPVSSEELNELFASAWPGHQNINFKPILTHALAYICAYDAERLIGFVKVVGDGGIHGFLLDPTVAPDWQRQGIGTQLVKACAAEVKSRGVEWLHVDYEPGLRRFYQTCGFYPTEAGLYNLRTRVAT